MEKKEIKKIGVLTSGGDAPGMNAAIRAVARAGIANGVKVIGFLRGYDGLIKGDYVELDSKKVAETIQLGGTILRSARCKEMMTDEGKERAMSVYNILGLDALVVIGGDGSLSGGVELSKRGANIMGIPGTIDLDLACSEYTIGFDTAVNTAMHAVNKLRDTSSSHDRCTVIEVMGRDAGYIALWNGIINGAEEVLIPERPDITEDEIVENIIQNRNRGKISNVIIMAEGFTGTTPTRLARRIEEVTGIESRATILGHLQRGGTPTAIDRMHASIMGANAVQGIIDGNKNRIIIMKDGKYADIDIAEGLSTERVYDDTLYQLTKMFSL